ncbi:MAG: DUF4381 domain-containing protein [Planctomycetota bacterium]
MIQEAPSLDRLHDIALPVPVPWWPPAVGWWFVLGALLLALAWFGAAAFARWRANAYRRAALRELESAADALAVAEVVRRTALASAPRETIAARTGDAWVDWLAERWGRPVPDSVRELLARGIYAPSSDAQPDAELRAFARSWISDHCGDAPC